ncbi:NADP-dependent oxidoreductase domain-containing protein [Geopyxis carbonaria]|nr:NADP-dependent oxidoreductase domain-containing protein [Geopyxis carbonaria]
MSAKLPPTLILGCASFGTPTYATPAAVTAALTFWASRGLTSLDTAARYPAPAPGTSESLLGATLPSFPRAFEVHTKILPGLLTRERIHASFAESMSRLGVAAVHTLYSHTADTTTPLLEQAAAFDELFRLGKFARLGVSNWPVALLAEFLAVCDAHGFVKPAVYQGHYNAIARAAEAQLLPLLREHGIAFAAYSPVAGGFFTGALTRGEVEGTRFAPGDRMGEVQRGWYDKPAIHRAWSEVGEVVARHGLRGPAVALRWAAWHSALTEGDGIILGSSCVKQLEENVDAVAQGPLPAEVAEVVERSWGIVQEGEGET